MSTETEGTFKVGKVELYTKTWTPQGPVKAKLIFIHGFSDHINRYYELFPSLAAQGIQTFGFDQRGWGRSVRQPSDKGLTGSTALVLSDIAAFIEDKLEPSAGADKSVPVFLMGNSMGGGQVATLASDAKYANLVSRIRGFILEAPFIAFPPGEEPSFLKVFFGKLASRILPRQPLLNALPAEYFSRDPEVVKSVREDALCHDTGTLEGLAGLLERTDMLASGAAKLSPQVRSLLVAHGSGDRTTDPNASKNWFEKQSKAAGVQDATYKSYDGAYHQLHADLCKDEFYKDVADWILERAGEGKPESKL
ncbi:alpha/beta hydrolase [Plectosphaerella cucumerina]|uniref:Alpha/beta hydrolase n=1 Tax=Plectosphaerella cucumerina TaxID=40658 RepID=A0A8K0TIT9_9PEZI|nr:alpha/beta hydrolase [Plectosphaerella cucumerina]